MIRVLVAALAPEVRAGLRALLDGDDLHVSADGASPDAIEAAAADADVVVVADEELLTSVADVLADEGARAIVLLADDDRAGGMLRGLALRGWGIVPRDASAAELRAAVSAVAQGFVVLPPALAGRTTGERPHLAPDIDPLEEPLTPRERDVLELLGQGLSNRLIARRLGISEHTVKFHVSSIYGKLGATSRTDAVTRGARRGLISL